ncbi:cytosine permease [Bacillus sp. JJ1503]|uniref:cytosine permease n=1 Tax=Bacillus sp. JJ1503 TaxID=3122956 RepID=UPI002FFE90BB
MGDNTKESAFMDEDVYKKVSESAKQHWVSFLMIFIGMWASLGAIGVGVDIGTKLTPWKASLAFFIGYVICMVFGYLVGEIGRREGFATAVLCERPFSKYGKLLPAFLSFIIAGIFIGVQADAIARIAMSILGFEVNEGFNLVRGLVSAGLCSLMMFSSYRGIKYIKIISWISVPIFLILLISTFFLSIAKYPGGLSAIMTTEANEVSFSSVMFLGVSLYAGFSAFMPDVSRFVSTRSGLLKALVIGYVASTFIPIWGLVVGVAQGGGAYYNVFSHYGVAFSIFAIVGLFLLQWTTNDSNAFTSGLSLSTIFTTLNNRYKSIPRLSRKQATLVPAIVGITLAFVGSGAVSSILAFVRCSWRMVSSNGGSFNCSLLCG